MRNDAQADKAERRALWRAGPKRAAVGVPAIASSLEHAFGEMGVRHSIEVLSRVNHDGGFDCLSCAWPDPDPEHRRLAEFCENGAKAVAWEASRKRVDADFFARHSVEELRAHDDHWLESNGRLTEPVHLARGATHFAPISSRAAWVRTICRTARTCATSRPARRCRPRSGSPRAR